MRSLTVVLTAVAVSLLIGITPGRAQAQIPSLPELLSRLENYDLQSRTKHAANPHPKQLEQIRLRVEASFRTANFRALLEAMAEADSLYAGRKWDDREKYLRSLSLEIDRAVVEPNEPVQASLIQLYPAELPKTSQQLAASFRIKPETGPGKLTIFKEHLSCRSKDGAPGHISRNTQWRSRVGSRIHLQDSVGFLRQTHKEREGAGSRE
ncbi:MAG: hypothetical protein DMF61_26470 [Blastocatellia bacterium AA13]|nr:MAG: hypothetical protein DMF61_26470 [Blastocatellia bacterium AA13]